MSVGVMKDYRRTLRLCRKKKQMYGIYFWNKSPTALSGHVLLNFRDFVWWSEMRFLDLFLFIEEIKRELKGILIYECRCNERLKAKAEGSTRLTYTGLRGELEHLKIKTRLPYSIERFTKTIIYNGVRMGGVDVWLWYNICCDVAVVTESFFFLFTTT